MMNSRNKIQGAMLLMTMLLLGILWFAVLSFATASFSSLRLSSAYLASERATSAAEAGIVLTVQMLRANPEYRPVKKFTKLRYSAETFQVEVLAPNRSPIPIPEGALYIRSIGKARTGQQKTAACVVKIGTKAQGLFDFALFINDLDVRGGSNVRAYDGTNIFSPLKGKATIGSNSTKKGGIRLDSGVTVDGQVFVGPGGMTTDKPKNIWESFWGLNNVVWKNWNATTTGETTLEKIREYPPVKGPVAGTQNLKVDWRGADVKPGAYKELQVDGGGQARLAGGSYVFDQIKLGGGARIVVTGTEPVYVYIKSKLDLSNGTFFNSNQNARNLIFLVEDKGVVNISGGTSANAIIYGPGASVNISGGNILYGAVVADTMKLEGGSQFYYDVGLKEKPPTIPGLSSGSGAGSGSLTVLGWQRF